MTPDPRPFRLGIVGAGIMGERMLRAAADPAAASLVTLSGIWDRDPAALARVASLGAPPAASVDAVLAGCDCLYVATPPATHIPYADQALAVGKAVFLEKPLATDPAEAAAFDRRAEGAPVAVNFPFASSFAVDTLRTWLTEGAVGTPQSLAVSVAFATWPRPWQRAAAAWLDDPAEGGFTREVVSHFLFLSRRLLGPLDLTTARVTPGARTEAAIEATLAAGGVPATLLGAVGATPRDDTNAWTLEGPAGAIRLRDWSIAERRGADGHWTPDPDAQPNERMRPLVLRRQLEGVARMVRGESHGLATVREALEVQQVVERILAAPAETSPPDA